MPRAERGWEYVIVDLPDTESATAVALTVNASGGATARTVVLLTPEKSTRPRRARSLFEFVRGLPHY